MSERVSTLAPLFRSDSQMRLLAEVFYGRAASGAELARRTGIPQQTVARELSRLEEAGLIVIEQVGNAKLATPNTSLPFFAALKQLLAYVGGVVPALAVEFEPWDSISEVFVYGSWARRFHGESGRPPKDIDVVVVSDSVTRFDLAEARMNVEKEAGTSIDLHVLSSNSERLTELREGSVVVFRRGS